MNTQLDISVMAIHQCARFCSHPKVIHELAVKESIWYLNEAKETASSFNQQLS
jgi:hypothetical protein